MTSAPHATPRRAAIQAGADAVVGNLVVEALRSEGLDANGNGSHTSRIAITIDRWRKTLPSDGRWSRRLPGTGVLLSEQRRVPVPLPVLVDATVQVRPGTASVRG